MPLIACFFNKLTLVLMNCLFFFLKVEHAPGAEDQFWRRVWWGHGEADGFDPRAGPSGALTNYLCMLQSVRIIQGSCFLHFLSFYSRDGQVHSAKGSETL